MNVRILLVAAAGATLLASACQGTAGGDVGDRVVLVTIDGLRWQEIFRGADTALIAGLDPEAVNVDSVLSRYDGNSPEERREKLMPFFWQLLAPRGVVYGDRDAGSTVRVTNGRDFSYPGYNELLTGYPDDRIDSNDKVPNPNVTVLEWIRQQPGFEDGVAAFGSWDVFPFIINEERSGVYVEGGWEEYRAAEMQEPLFLLRQISRALPHEWPDIRYDALTAHTALTHMAIAEPRVLYLALDETDTRAHEGHYDRYLDAISRIDFLLMLVWDAIQGVGRYRGRTTLIMTSDHGRGSGGAWTDHGAEVEGSEYGWWAAIGPYTPDRGLVQDDGELTLGQTAATVAAAVGLDYGAEVPAAAPAVAGVLAR